MILANNVYKVPKLKDLKNLRIAENDSVNRYSFINKFEENELEDIENIINNKDISIDNKIELFYSKLNSSIHDIFRIIADYTSLYIINGEGLLIHVCMLLSKFYSFRNEEDQNILSFNNSLNISSIIYYIEKVLRDFALCNSNFHIIFFNVFNVFFEKETKLFENYNILRNAFIIHCKKNLIPYYIFDNWYNDNNYNIYIIKYKPLFMFVEDSSSFLYLFNKFYVSEVNEENELDTNATLPKGSEVDEKTNNNSDKILDREKNRKEYLKKKKIYDYYNEEIREISLCFYFLLINNILRDIKSVLFFNAEIEKNTVNAFSINYKMINFKTVEKLNEESASLFEKNMYQNMGIRESIDYENANSNYTQINISQNIKDYDLIYNDEKNYSKEELELLELFSVNVKSDNINLKNIVLNVFYSKIKETIMNDDEKKNFTFLTVKLIFMHNYLIEKLNMKNLNCMHDIEKTDKDYCSYNFIKSQVERYILSYLNIYNLILKSLQGYMYCDALQNIRNTDILHFFNSSIIHNLISFICYKIRENNYIINYDDFSFEDSDFFEKAFKNVVGNDDMPFFPINFEFLLNCTNLLPKNETNIVEGNDSNIDENTVKDINQCKSEISNNNKIINVNLINIKNEFIENFFHIDNKTNEGERNTNDITNENNKGHEIKYKVNYVDKCIEYDTEFFELCGLLHITQREEVYDIYRRYIKMSKNSRISKVRREDERNVLRGQQKEERRNAIIAKYFYISSLHHPIIISENHPWLKYYIYNIDKLYNYLKNEENKKVINMRMKRIFEETFLKENTPSICDAKSKQIKKQQNYVKMFEVLDDISGDDSSIENDGQNNKGKKGQKEKEEKKHNKGGNSNQLTRKDEILKRKELLNEKKLYEVDLERYNVLEAKINKLSSNNNYSEMNTWSLDIISGFNRLVDVYNFNNVSNLIKNPTIQLKASMKVLSNMFDIIMHTKLKNVKTNKQKSDAIRSVMLIYKLVNEIFNKFKEHLTEKDIVQLQTVLLSLGFRNSSYNLFEEYIKIKMKQIEEENNNDAEEDKTGKNKKNVKGKEKTKLKGGAKGGKNKEEEKMGLDKTKKKGREESNSEIGVKGSDRKEIKELYKYKIESVKSYSELKIDEDKEHEFQLYYMYYLLDRTTGNIKDKRVLFTLDTWQYNILNLVDRRKSILVSCPTSSGKTFICYYVMDKVLRLNNDSVVVYVAPNDTLALQVFHEVNGRFSTKSYSKYGESKLCSYLTDKYAQDKALEAQIVIILPSVLENILLSYYSMSENTGLETKVSKFISRIEYIIFDEIHCIGDKEFYGPQIENIIHLTTCPFLALSATIGNIKYFYDWLKNVMIKKGKDEKDLHLIKFYERFSDLVLYVYTNKNLHHLNPLACYNYRDILYKGINKDFYCNPREIYEIIMLLFELARQKNFYDLVEFLEPSFYFKYTRCINKKQFIYYMHSVKEMIIYLIQNKYITSSDYDMFIHMLLSNYLKNTDVSRGEKKDEEKSNKEKKIEKREIAKESDSSSDSDEENKKIKSMQSITKHLYKRKVQDDAPKEKLFQELYKNVVLDEKHYLNKSNDLVKYTETVNVEQEYLDSGNLIELLKHLEDVNFLPCIVFNFERKELEDMTINLINELMRRQHDKYYGTDERAFNTKMENKLRQERYENLLKQREMLLKIKTVSRNQRLEQNLDKDYLDMLNEDEIPEPPIDISEEYDGDFYFCNRKVYHNYVFEIEDLIKDAERAIEGRKNKDILIEGLKRGIGLHYEVLPYKFTIIVESLFRLGYIKIIFSNKNLSLGINIPCKSIIFTGHTYELNSLMFKQTSGRAGRRGFDLYGNIIIWNINFKNLKRLITCPLQTLSGTYCVNFTNICRSMLLYNCLKKYREMEEIAHRNKAVVNKPSKKKKKEETMSVAEKEEIFEKNRFININYFSRVNGILSLFYNTLYYINAFHDENNKALENIESNQNGERVKGGVNKTIGDNNVSHNMNNCDIICENDCLNFQKEEFLEYKEKDISSDFINRKYEYNELICEIIENKKKNKYMSIFENQKNLKELSFMIKIHFLIYINILVEMEALDDDGNVINLTELSILLKKECDNNFLLTHLFRKRIIHNLIGDDVFLSYSNSEVSLQKIIDCITFEKNYSRNAIVDDASRGKFILLFILSHFINKIKENKIALTNILINYNNKSRNRLELFSHKYFPLLHTLPKSVQNHVNNLEKLILNNLINYSIIIISKLKLWNRKKTYLLPYTQLYIFEEHPSSNLNDIFNNTNSEFINYYKEKVDNYNIRSPFLAPLYKNDKFDSLCELLYTSLIDLDMKKNMIPDIMEDYVYFYKFENGLIKEEKACLKNSYMIDYFLHGKYYVLRNKNKLGQYTWYIIDRFIDSLKNIENYLYEIKREKDFSNDIFYTCLSSMKDVLQKHFKSINSE
ncbi:DEAD/DEAH box helicase, putative [Plasmodium vinckei]|uniref:DEAD/DEAH box helicase, putative n=1 Tax=Plasmodium vinckei TaxID=5860 RepID=A0A6V7SIC6_PLAVN|nr:DEAD/DEAH box helicase, putative [Plasmodium vinckei]